MVRLRFKIALVVAVLLAVLVWVSGYRHGASRHATSGPNASPILPKDITERITVDPNAHKLTISTKSGNKDITLPDRSSTIDVLKNGEVKVTSPQFGLEHHIFGGFSMSDNLRLTMGLDGLYYKRLDLGIGLASQFGNHSPIALAKLSYNVYGNIQAGVMYGSNQTIGAVITVRLF